MVHPPSIDRTSVDAKSMQSAAAAQELRRTRKSKSRRYRLWDRPHVFRSNQPDSTESQYRLTAMTCTIAVISNIKNKGMCKTCQSENRCSYILYSEVRRPALRHRSA